VSTTRCGEAGWALGGVEGAAGKDVVDGGVVERQVGVGTGDDERRRALSGDGGGWPSSGCLGVWRGARFYAGVAGERDIFRDRIVFWEGCCGIVSPVG
jgi:hypothetical protein